MQWIKSFRLRKALNEIVTSGTAVACALILWRMWICVTGCKSSFAIVVSGSMEPGIRRGDILFLHNSRDPIRTREIVVFNTNNAPDIPIVRRVIQVHEGPNTVEINILTKASYLMLAGLLCFYAAIDKYILIGALGLLEFV